MTSRERVLMALNHEEPDCVPLDIGGCNDTTFHVQVSQKLKEYYHIDYEDKILHTADQIVVPDDKLLNIMGGDCRSVYFPELPYRYDEESGNYIDQWGISYQKSPDGYFYDFVDHPLKAAEEIEDLDISFFPSPEAEYRLEGLEKVIQKHKGDKCLVLEGFRECLFGLPLWLRGYENFLMDVGMDEDEGMASALCDKLLEYHKKIATFLLTRFGKDLDIVKVADDLGSQKGLLLSRKAYQRIVKPRQAELYAHIKSLCDCKLLLHSCGAISDIFPDLIEIGVDAINPVQTTAAGMEPEKLKKEFGDKITFWGGGIDTQKTLPFGTISEIRNKVKENMEIFKQGGGFVFAQVHNITPEVPLENLLAMYEAYNEFKYY